MEHSKIKKRVRQNDGSKIPKTKRTTKPTTHRLTLLPFPHKKKKKKKKNRRKKLHQFHVICNKVATTAENERSQTYKWRERSRAQLRYSEDFL
jgi:hypothetical protein